MKVKVSLLDENWLPNQYCEPTQENDKMDVCKERNVFKFRKELKIRFVKSQNTDDGDCNEKDRQGFVVFLHNWFLLSDCSDKLQN